MKSTQTDLPLELNKIRERLETKLQLTTLDSLLKNALNGDFHDEKSVYANPKPRLISQLALLLPHTSGIIERVKNGDYNEKQPVS